MHAHREQPTTSPSRSPLLTISAKTSGMAPASRHTWVPVQRPEPALVTRPHARGLLLVRQWSPSVPLRYDSGTLRDVAIVARDLRSAGLAREIEAEIESGRLQAGRQLPPERELGERFGVSRVTVRSALADLERRGLVDRHPGRGTFVATRRLGESAGSLTSFTELGAQRGLVASAVVLDARTVSASVEDSEAFSMAPGADIYELTRVRLLDGLPISIDRSRCRCTAAAAPRSTSSRSRMPRWIASGLPALPNLVYAWQPPSSRRSTWTSRRVAGAAARTVLRFCGG